MTIEIPEGVEEVETSLHGVSVRKVLIDGHVYILTPDGKIYDANGRMQK